MLDTYIWTRSNQYCTEQHSAYIVSSQLCRALSYMVFILMDMNAHIHFNVYECSLLKGGNGEGQPNKVTAVAIQPRPHFFENPCQHSANPDNQALTKHSSRKSIKPLLSSSPLLLSLASATRAVQALPLAPLCAQRSISPFHQAPPSNSTPQLPGSSRTDSQGHSSSSLSGPSTGSLGQHRCPN